MDKNAKEFHGHKAPAYGSSDIPKNEIRIKSDRSLSGYLKYAYTCLEKEGMDEVVIKGVGQAMNRIVDLAELIKSRIAGLYSNTEMLTQVDKFDETRTILSLKITLSKKKLDETSPGYQEPIDEKLVTPYVEEPEDYKGHDDDEGDKPAYRSRGRGFRGERGYRGGYRGRGDRGGRGFRGRGRGGRGSGRGRGRGYNSYYNDE